MKATLTLTDNKQIDVNNAAYIVLAVGAETYYISASPNDGLLVEVKHTENDQQPLATDQDQCGWQVWRVKDG